MIHQQITIKRELWTRVKTETVEIVLGLPEWNRPTEAVIDQQVLDTIIQNGQYTVKRVSRRTERREPVVLED